MRILGACIFLSFLAGKLRHLNRMLLTKLEYACFKHPYFLAGKTLQITDSKSTQLC